MEKLSPEAVRAALQDIQIKTGSDLSCVLAYITELESKVVKIENELQKHRTNSVRKFSADSSMNSRLKDALRE
ncbi:hypothetical protein ACX1C1_23205 [Paenibacillus sp. strain BS8-2]